MSEENRYKLLPAQKAEELLERALSLKGARTRNLSTVSRIVAGIASKFLAEAIAVDFKDRHGIFCFELTYIGEVPVALYCSGHIDTELALNSGFLHGGLLRSADEIRSIAAENACEKFQ